MFLFKPFPFKFRESCEENFYKTFIVQYPISAAKVNFKSMNVRMEYFWKEEKRQEFLTMYILKIPKQYVYDKI